MYGAGPLVVRVAWGTRRWALVVEQDACRTGEYGFRGVVEEQVLESRRQMPGATPLVSCNGFYDGPG
ncbi:hypothetical protein ACIRJM_09260 [Streptomyces sp. NPDC102405]|uniref:hypothetical protein n=1 Tax=Streptomyces sp. NPDC102405 TaxID=3366170 RepID=UPI00380BC378